MIAAAAGMLHWLLHSTPSKQDSKLTDAAASTMLPMLRVLSSLGQQYSCTSCLALMGCAGFLMLEQCCWVGFLLACTWLVVVVVACTISACRLLCALACDCIPYGSA